MDKVIIILKDFPEDVVDTKLHIPPSNRRKK